MWRFAREAGDQLAALGDRISLAMSSFSTTVGYFGEQHKAYESSKFFAIFQTFLTSYKARAFIASRASS
jgi:hypothetical protein